MADIPLISVMLQNHNCPRCHSSEVATEYKDNEQWQRTPYALSSGRPRVNRRAGGDFHTKFNSQFWYLFSQNVYNHGTLLYSHCKCKFIYCKICFENLYRSPYMNMFSLPTQALSNLQSFVGANKGLQRLLFQSPKFTSAIHYPASLEACCSAIENHTTCCSLSCLHISLLLLLRLPTKACSISPQRATTPVQFEEALHHDLLTN